MSLKEELQCGKPKCACHYSSKKGEGKKHCPVPTHGKGRGDIYPSFSVTLKDNGKEVFRCHAGCTQDEVIAALKERGLWADPAPRAARRRQKKVEAARQEWEAKHAETLEYVSTHIRIDQPDGKKSVFWKPSFPDGIKSEDLALYRYAQVLTGNPDSVVVVCEGEKAADALATIEKELGVVAVGTITGAAVIPGDSALSILNGRTVILWPDNDAPGCNHMNNIATRLHALGGSNISMVDWPDAPAGGDAADAVESSIDIAALFAASIPWQLTDFDLEALLKKVVHILHRYVVLNVHQVTAIALWIAHSHAFEAAECTPYLSINSVEKQSGKTRLLEVLEYLVANAWLTARTSTAALKNKIDADHPTLLLDESDTAFKSDKEYSESLRGVLNSGYRKRGVYSTSVKVNGNWVNKDFSTFCAKAIAGIGKLPDTIADRSIPIEMKRAAPNEKVAAFRERDARPELEPVQTELSEWAAWHEDALAAARPSIPNALSDRSQDVWEPLICVADIAGDGWPERAREAAITLSSREATDADSLRVSLLGDIKGVFQITGLIRIPTPTLIDELVAIDVAPWGDLPRSGKPLDNRSLARLLRDFPIKPTIWKEDGHTVRGYLKDDFLDAWSRYVVWSETSETRETHNEPAPVQVSLVSAVSDKSGGAEGKELWKV